MLGASLAPRHPRYGVAQAAVTETTTKKKISSLNDEFPKHFSFLLVVGSSKYYQSAHYYIVLLQIPQLLNNMSGIDLKEIAKYPAEFFGTFTLCFTVGCVVLGGTASTWGATCIAMSLMVGIYALGPVSGANFNPAVTLSLMCSKKIPIRQGAVYWIFQLFGGLAAGAVVSALFQKHWVVQPQGEYTWKGAGYCEFLFTFMLCFVVENVTGSASSGNQYFGLAIALVIVAGGSASGAISGGCLNPAVGISSFSFDCVYYMIFQFAGAICASIAYRYVRPEDFDGEAKTLQSRLTAECIGTFLLTSVVGFITVTESATGAWAPAACLVSIVYAMGNCSGGHFNPAVTVGIFFSGRGLLTVSDMAVYIAAQLLGASLGALGYVCVTQSAFGLGPGIGFGQLCAGEIFFTCLLVFVVLSVATTKEPSKDYFGLIIGMVVTVAGFAGGRFGCCINPAVAVGIDVAHMTNLKGFSEASSIFYYCACEFVGAIIAVGIFRLLRQEEYEEEDDEETKPLATDGDEPINGLPV